VDFAVNQANSRILKTLRIVDQLCILTRIPDRACLDDRILGPKRNLDPRSFSTFCWHVNEFIQIIIFFLDEAHLNSGVRLLLEVYCVVVVKHVAFFTCAK